jgi:transketolase
MQLGDHGRIIRREIIEMAHRSGAAHIGSALSCTDILVSLYFHTLRLFPWEQRDFFILSKAHASMALYATLAHGGILPKELLKSYYQDGGELPGHLDRRPDFGIECSTGSLGHGFNIALGMAYGLKKEGSARRVFVLMGDGESQEGSIWEGAMFASRMGLSSVTAIIDYNKLQGYGRPNDICMFEPVVDKWIAFGWDVTVVNGHNHTELAVALSAPPSDKPRMIVANTIKGKGVSFMEDALIWHYYIVTDEIRQRALEELR